jgi:hypothetical protein
MALQPFVEPSTLFQFLIQYTVGRTPWTRDQPVARPEPKHRTTQRENTRTQTTSCKSYKLRGLSPQANYIDRSTAACRRI